MTLTLDSTTVADQLATKFGLNNVQLHYGLSQNELFHAAIANDRGRISLDGPSDAQKAYATSLGEDGPLVYYGDPTCTGRPVQDTFAVAWPELVDEIWWKPDFKQFDPTKYEALLARVIDHLNTNNAELLLHRCVLRLGSKVRQAIPLRRRVCHPRILRQHHVPQQRPRRHRPRRRRLDHDQRSFIPLRPRARWHRQRTRP